MTTLFTATMFHVESAVYGARHILSTESMKAAKAYIVSYIERASACGGVLHRDHMRALFAVALNCTRKQAFADALDGVKIDNVTLRIDYAVRVTGRVVATGKEIRVGRADVAHMPKVGDILAVHDLMNSEYVEGVEITGVEDGFAPAAPVMPEAFEIEIKGSVGLSNPFHAGDVVYVGAIENMKATVTTMPKVGDVIEATGGIYNETQMVKVRQILNDYPQRPAHMEAAMNAHHHELFSGFFNDRPRPTPERKIELEDMTHDQIYIAFAVMPEVMPVKAKTRAARRTKVEKIHHLRGADTFRVQLDNGRVYLYTEGEDYARVKQPGGKLSDVTTPYTLGRIRNAIASQNA